MLKKGFIAGNSLYSSIAHDNLILEHYASELVKVFSKISDLNSSEGVLGLLEDGPSQAGFQRLA
jgi:glutamate-1-semialdehyde 2,1-aminomutase